MPFRNRKGAHRVNREKIFVQKGRGEGYKYQTGEMYFQQYGNSSSGSLEFVFKLRGSFQVKAKLLRDLRLHLKELLEQEGYIIGFKEAGGGRLNKRG